MNIIIRNIAIDYSNLLSTENGFVNNAKVSVIRCLEDCNEVDDINDKLVETVHAVGAKFCKTRRRRTQKLSDHTLNLMAVRREMKLHSSTDLTAYRHLNRQISKCMRRDLHDLVITEEDPLILESMIQALIDRSREVGIEINICKTKMMTNSIPIDITINGQKLEYVEEYVKKEKWSKQVTVWYPRNSTRSQGRKSRRWEDDLKLTLEPLWIRVAADTRQRKDLEEAFVERHTEIRDIL
ncbi:unnamed protein product [Parnassius mnemosyne]|uniref:Reverse transcriptase n=1 Tax=Parnassius mnemosyne TaxID=213953 RepID=A0AAV1KHR4_9NEOP